MASENETVADIVNEKRDTADEAELKGKNTFAFDLAKMLREEADRIEAAHQREVAELKRQIKEALAIASDIDKCASIERHTDAMLKKNEVIVGLRKEVAELRECLKEAIREKCPFTRMSCKHGEPCDYECGTVKWRKALQDEGGAK